MDGDVAPLDKICALADKYNVRLKHVLIYAPRTYAPFITAHRLLLWLMSRTLPDSLDPPEGVSPSISV